MNPTGRRALFHLWRTGHVAGLAASLLLAANLPAHAAHELFATGENRFSSMGRAISSAGDFNGDGFDDFVVGVPFRFRQPGPGTATIYFGAPQGQDFSSFVLSGTEPGDGFGSLVGSAGDLDADGFGDLLVTAAAGVSVFRGGAAPDAVVDLLLPARPGRFGGALAPAGDWNGDGYDDFMVGAPLDSTVGPNAGRVYVFFGGVTLDETPDVVLEGSVAGDELGTSLAGGVDVNGDGFDDIVAGAPYADNAGASLVDCGEVRVYFGGPGIFDATPDRVIKGRFTNGYFGLSVALLADWNSDGVGDLAVGAPGEPTGGTLFIFYGGPAADAVADWTVGNPAFTLGSSIAACDDVNRDHVSDLVAADTHEEPRVFFGGAAADTLPDAPLSVLLPPVAEGARYVAHAGDVNGDGFQDWLYGLDAFGGQLNGDFVRLFTAHGDLQLVNVSNAGNPLLGGAPALVQWVGGELMDIEYARDGATWQTLAYGIQGGGIGTANSTTVTIPPGRADGTARFRLVSLSPADTLIDMSDRRFSVTDSIQTECFGGTAMPGGTGITWSAIWPGYAGATRQYRLYRSDGGGPETPVGPDPILEEGFLDPAATPASIYRLTALRPDGAEVPIDTVAAGSFSCDSIHLEEPNGGESLFLANAINVLWRGTRIADLQLSRDDGATWETVDVGLPPPSAILYGTAPATNQARVRLVVRGTGGAIWDDSDAPFSIHTSLQLLRFVAIPLPTGGVALEWDSSPEPSLETFLGYRLCRADTLPQPLCNPIGPWPNPATSYTDPAGTPGSVYRLWGVLFDYTEVLLGDVTVASGPGTSAALGPSPARANEEVVLTMVSPVTPNGPATDVEVRVYDTTGRMVALLGSGLGIDGTITLRWTPVNYGMRAGIYWIRARSASTNFSSNRRIVVL